jgi:hypothetical protein
MAVARRGKRFKTLPVALSQCFPRVQDARTESAWTSYLSGVFSLCVADPSTELSIARKEVLQEALTEINDRQPEPESSEVDKQKILELVEQYARASMPFSPPEYPRSSRKRLVEDLGARLRGV